MAMWRIEYWNDEDGVKDFVDLDLPETNQDQEIIETWFQNNLEIIPTNRYGTKL